MEKIIRLPEGFYLAALDAIQGFVAQGRAIDIDAQNRTRCRKKLIEAQYSLLPQPPEANSITEYPLIAGA